MGRRVAVGVVLGSLVAALLTGIVPLFGVAPAGASDDTVLTFGIASFNGSTSGMHLNAPLIDIMGTKSGSGYWLLSSDGGVFSFGDARFHGSTGGMRLNRPIIGGTATPTGNGYWLFASDGGVFSFGDARFFGSTGGIRLNRPIVDMIAAPAGLGYWLVASDGGVFSFGSARFYGSTGGIRLVQPIVAAAPAYHGLGYTLVAADGGVFTFGRARFFGSGAGIFHDPVVDIATTPNGDGYWLASESGQVQEFGNTKHYGDGAGVIPYERRVVAMESPWRYGYRLVTAPRPGVVPQMGPGSSGPAVTDLQNRLVGMGYWLGAADGGYGLLTEQAVTAFQKVNGLPRTGRIDAATQLALQVATRPLPRSTSGNVIELDKARQVIFITSGGRVQWVINTSTGTEQPYTYGGVTYIAHTPEGHFTILRAINGVDHGRLGDLYRPRYFTNDGVAFHGSSSIPPYPASHGCSRMTNAAMDYIWATNLMPIGAPVWVY
jgi:hypothetical protein